MLKAFFSKRVRCAEKLGDPLAMSISEKCSVGSLISEYPEKVHGQGVSITFPHLFHPLSAWIMCSLVPRSLIVNSHNI